MNQHQQAQAKVPQRVQVKVPQLPQVNPHQRAKAKVPQNPLQLVQVNQPQKVQQRQLLPHCQPV